MRRTRSTGCADCCARAATGHVAAPPTSVMKSRRRIAFTKAGTTLNRTITAGICNRRNGVQRLVCTAAILNCSCPLWARSGHPRGPYRLFQGGAWEADWSTGCQSVLSPGTGRGPSGAYVAGHQSTDQPGNSTVSITWITPFDCMTLRMVT